MPIPFTLPFYHETGHGLYWTPDRLVWVALRRSGSTVRPVGCWSVAVRNGDADHALRRLVDLVDPDDRTVGTHVAPSLVRCVEASMDPYDDRDAWMHEQVEQMLPDTVSPSDFVARMQPLASDDADRVLIALTRRSAADARREQLETVDLTPVVVTDLRLAFGLAYAYDARFTSGDAVGLLTHEDRAWRLSYRSGRLAVQPESLPTRGRDALDDVRLTEPDAPIFTAGAQAPTDSSVQREAPGSPVHADVRFGPDASAGDAVVARDVPAAACAMLTLYPEAGPINFVDADDVGAAQEAQDRRDALRVMLGVGAVVGLLLLATTVATLTVDGWSRDADVELERQADRLARVEAAQRTRDALRERLRRSRTLVHRRTHTATLLERVGRSVPDAAWLDGLTITRGEEGGDTQTMDRETSSRRDTKPTLVRIRGFAEHDAAVAAFLGALERKDGLSAVRLTTSERLTAESVTRQTGLDRDHLYRFDVRLRYRSTP